MLIAGELLHVDLFFCRFAASSISAEDRPEPSYGEETLSSFCCQGAYVDPVIEQQRDIF